ncbi:MAG: electron transfer flavoprotein subunit beta/FixA family protein, partial [Candidatus Lokiarchaeota archaeon]|nr:electron transfer flavoprotein subunit beta/FixA family protein [Candidatus Lokiarchaeota archaeon]
MRFIVCVKEVPESIDVKIDLKTNKLQEEGISTTLNPFDQFILEEALKLKKDEDEIIAISVGTPQTKMVLMKCLALGADKAILLSDNVFMGSDSFATAYTLSKVINKIGDFNIIFCGQQTVDGNTAQVGPELAAQLKIPQVTYVESVDKFEGQKLVVKSQTDEGFKIVESQIPVLLAG